MGSGMKETGLCNWKKQDAECGSWVDFATEIASVLGFNMNLDGYVARTMYEKLTEYEK